MKDEPEQSQGMFRAAADELFDRVRALSDVMRSASGTALGAVGAPLPMAAADVLSSLRSVVEQAPPPTAALDLLLEEVRAKRSLVQAMQVQLASFDSQLEVLERSLHPLHEWSKQWTRLQATLGTSLRPSWGPGGTRT